MSPGTPNCCRRARRLKSLHTGHPLDDSHGKGDRRMEAIFGCCCGLDVHKRMVTACHRVQGIDGKVHKEIQTFGTMTADLLVLHDWLVSRGVTHVAMESTGVNWKPIYNILEAPFTILLVNAAHIKAVTGRKTDVKDCEWIADLLAHGLLRGGFIPPEPVSDLRDLTRYRKSLSERASTGGEPFAQASGIVERQVVVCSDGCDGGIGSFDVGCCSGW